MSVHKTWSPRKTPATPMASSRYERKGTWKPISQMSPPALPQHNARIRKRSPIPLHTVPTRVASSRLPNRLLRSNALPIPLVIRYYRANHRHCPRKIGSFPIFRRVPRVHLLLTLLQICAICLYLELHFLLVVSVLHPAKISWFRVLTFQSRRVSGTVIKAAHLSLFLRGNLLNRGLNVAADDPGIETVWSLTRPINPPARSLPDLVTSTREQLNRMLENPLFDRHISENAQTKAIDVILKASVLTSRHARMLLFSIKIMTCSLLL